MAKSGSGRTTKEVLRISRPVWWITTTAPFVAGYLVADQGIHWVTLIVGVVYFALCYNLLMYGINDIFDYESDIRNPRKRDILAKYMHRRLLGIIAAVNVPVWLYFVVQGSLAATVWLLCMLFLVVAYSVKGLRFKEVPFLDSLTSSFHYTSPFIFGLLLAGGDHLWLPAFTAFFVWAMANHALGAIQDIVPDREAGIGSIATRLGAEKTIVFCLSSYIVAALLPVLHYGWAGLPVSAVLLWYVVVTMVTIPFRHREGHAIFRRAWQVLVRLHYIAGGAVSMYLIVLARAQ